MVYNIGANTFMTTAFMWMGTIPAFIFLPLIPAIKRRVGKKGLFNISILVAILGMMLMYIFVSIPTTRSMFWLLCIAQFVNSSGLLVATGYMWALVPEVVTYGEYQTEIIKPHEDNSEVLRKINHAVGAGCIAVGMDIDHAFNANGGYRENFSQELWDMAVRMIQQIFDTAKPVRTKFSIESMPWMIPSTPDEYLRLINDVDRPEFGTHLDAVNIITSPDKYFFNDRFLKECFTKLKGIICSCYLKDIRLKEEYTFQLQECAPGEGSLDIKLYEKLASAENPDMPMIIEHLTTDEEYAASVRYVRSIIG